MARRRTSRRWGFNVAMIIALSSTGVGSHNAALASNGSPRTETLPPGFEAEWAELISAAQAEGELVIVGVSRVVDGAEVEEAFSDQFGIDVTTSTGSGNDLSSRILAERGQGLYSVDVALYGNARIVEAGVFKPLLPELIHPEAIDRSQGWRI